MTLDQLKKRLDSHGIQSEAVRVWNHFGQDVPALRVPHNYDGYYRSDEARAIMQAAHRIATRAGFVADDRNTATIITYRQEA